MKFKTIVLFVLIIIFSFTVKTFAKENTSSDVLDIQVSPTTTIITPTRNPIKPSINAERREAAIQTKKDIIEARKNFTEEIKEIRKQQTEKIKEANLEFREKLKTIRDERKKTTVENINNKISTFNQNHTQKLSEALEKLQTILDKIKTKSQEAKLKGLNTVTLEADIIAAQSAIDSAKTVLAAQAAKQYKLEITSDATLKTTIGPIVSQFRLDLQGVQKSVTDARQAVHKAATELAKLKNENSNKVATPSATQ